MNNFVFPGAGAPANAGAAAAGANVNLALPVRIPHNPNRRANRRNLTAKNFRNYREIRGRCSKVTLADGSVVYPYYEYTGKTKMNALKTRRNAMRSIAFFTKKTFPGAPDGIYAWIYADKGFYAAKVKSTSEHGTRHIQLADRVSAAEINMAGEIEKTGRDAIFNFYSGTFMYPYIDEDSDPDIETTLAADAIKLFRSMGLNPTYGHTRNEIIQETPTIEELRSYKDLGFDVYLHKSKGGCETQRYYGTLPDESNIARAEERDAEIARIESMIAEFKEQIENNVGSSPAKLTEDKERLASFERRYKAMKELHSVANARYLKL